MIAALPPYYAERIVLDGDCWRWTAHLNPTGYGVAALRHNRTALAHRTVHELLVGPIPEGMTIDHLCRVKSCVNPEHMEIVTRGENTRRAMQALSLIHI